MDPGTDHRNDTPSDNPGCKKKYVELVVRFIYISTSAVEPRSSGPGLNRIPLVTDFVFFSAVFL